MSNSEMISEAKRRIMRLEQLKRDTQPKGRCKKNRLTIALQCQIDELQAAIDNVKKANKK